MMPSRASLHFVRVKALVLRRPLLSVFLLALVARWTAAVGIFLHYGGAMFGDDLMYSTMARQAAAHQTSSWDDYTHHLYHLTATFLFPLTWLYDLAGSHILVGQLFVGLFGALTAVLVTRLAMEAMSTRWALLPGAAVALLPSQILWSSLTLKDALVWACLAAIALLVAVAGRSGRVPLLVCIGGAVVLLVLLAYLRQHTLIVACYALALTAWVGNREFRLARGVSAVAIAALLPMAWNLGPGGINLIRLHGSDLAYQRAVGAQGASSALVSPTVSPSPVPTSSPTALSPGGSGQTSGTGSGTTSSTAQSSASPTAAPVGAPPANPSTVGEQVSSNLAYLPRGLEAEVLRPFPWEGGSGQLRLAEGETLLWWPLLAFAAVGVLEVRRHARVLLFPLVAGAALAGMWALTEGNLGTAFRHRGEFVWAVVLLAVLGARRLFAWFVGRRPGVAESHGGPPDEVNTTSPAVLREADRP